jgi:signal transduction histidine kinase
MENFDKAKPGTVRVRSQRATPVPELHVDTLGEILQLLGIQVLVFDETGRCSSASAGVDDLLGIAPASTAELVAALSEDPDALDEISAGLAAARHPGGSGYGREIGGIERDGREHSIELAAIGLSDGDEHRLLVLLKDCTELALLRNEVEVLDRQAAAGRFAASVAHEFNNILTAMLGWAQIARRTSTSVGDDRSQRALDTLEQSTQRARQIASQLLEASRPDRLPNRCFVPETAIEDALGMLAWELADAGVGVVRDFAASDQVRGDATRLVQLFVNLARNSIEAMPNGGTLRVSTRQHHGLIETVFTDDGEGIDPAIAERIFEPFFSTKRDRQQRDTGGSGLGLAICRSIVEDHGGEISAASNDLGGTSITVALPIATGRADHTSEIPTTRSSFPPGVKVLVVDDDLDIREMINTALTLRGAEVEIASSGSEALDCCRSQRFDVAFVDFSMVGLSGHDLGRALAEEQPDMPVVFMSGREPGAPRDSNVTDFLKKPFDLHEIQRMLRQVLDRRRTE